MKRIQYIRPMVKECHVEAQGMMALSQLEGSANKEYEVLVNEDAFTDIWGNEL